MNKGKKKKVYNRLIRKLLFQLAVLLAASAVAVSALRELLRGHVADGLVDVISRMLGISWLEGRAIYWRVVLDHMDLIIGGAVLVLFAAVKSWRTAQRQPDRRNRGKMSWWPIWPTTSGPLSHR